MRAIKSGALLFFVIIGVRCSDFSDGNTAAVQLAEGEKFSVAVEGLPSPNRFQAKIKFVGDLGRGYVVQKSGPSSTEVSTLALNSIRAEGIADQNIQPGQTYTYTIGLSEDGEFKAAQTETIHVVPDIIVSGDQIFKNEKQIEIKKQFRIYFLKDSSLKSLDLDVDINVEEIFSEGGKFQTFDPKDFPASGEIGKPSGKVSITAKKVAGPFSIEIRGQTGGQGWPGAQGITGSTGANSSVKVDEGHTLLSLFGGVACRREYFESNKEAYCPDLTYEQCRQRWHPGVGGKGGAGGPGYPGLVGARGGDTEDSEINLPTDNPDLKIIFESGAGGAGGLGGIGGNGGPGGSGGPRENVSPGMPCDPVPPGPVGDSGAAGVAGAAGPLGNLGKLKLNGVSK